MPLASSPGAPSATAPSARATDPNLSAFLWSVADLLRGDFKQSDYGKVILPFTVLRRLDCVLAPTKSAVLAELTKRTASGLNPEPFLLKTAGQSFFNTSRLDLQTLLGDQDHLAENLRAYVQAFSPEVRDIFERFDFHTQIDRLDKANLLYLVTEKFATIDLHPNVVDNARMGSVFEELIRKFAELSNETAGEHFTPREVIRLMLNLLFIEDDEALTKPGVVRSIYDPTAGTGGMLSVPGKKFDYMLSNPPFGVEWKKIEREVRKEAESRGFDGRFGIMLNGSPLFTGGAGSGESEIRRYMLENDLVEAIIALPTDLFYNTGIATYVWIVSNRKPAARKGLVQLVDASAMSQKMRKSLGSKGKELGPAHIDDITAIFGAFEEVTRDGVPINRIFRNETFGYRTITVERPERDADGNVVLATKGKAKGKPMPDAALRDTENVPLSEDVNAYFAHEVLPHAADAWIDHEKTKSATRFRSTGISTSSRHLGHWPKLTRSSNK